jgi:hypothetical protein
MPKSQTPQVLEFGDDTKPHDGFRGYPGQVTWLQASQMYRNVTLALGRQVGKSTTRKFLLLEDMAHRACYYKAIYGAQGHMQATKAFEDDVHLFEKAHLVIRAKDKGQDRYIEFKPLGKTDGAKVYYVSLDPTAHESLHGLDPHRIFLDEAALVPHEAYINTLLPMLSATRGSMFVAGSPVPEGMGFAWFEELWGWGDPRSPTRKKGYISFSAPSECNPYSWEWDIETKTWSCPTIETGRAAARKVSRSREMCLYDGKFAKDIGAVFSNLDAVFTLPYTQKGQVYTYQPPLKDVVYVAGVDLGRDNDYSITTIFRRDTCEQVALLVGRGDLMIQAAHIAALLGEYNPIASYMDAQGMGMGVYDLLRMRFGSRLIPVKWTSGGTYDKERCVTLGVDRFQNEGWHLMYIQTQRDEFRLFSKTPRGLHSNGWYYEAPSGGHDDYVTACLYASYGLPLVAAKVEAVEPEIKVGTREFFEFLERTQGGQGERGGFSLRKWNRRGF